MNPRYRAQVALLVGLTWVSGLHAQPAPAPPATPGPAPTAAPAATPALADASAAPLAGDPAPEVQAEYRTAVERAVTEFDAGRWAEARALFLRAHELWPSARTFRTLGMTSFELRAYARALFELQAALDDARRPLDEAQRSEVEQLLERTRPFVGRYRVSLSPAGAALLVNGTPQTLAGGVLVLEVGSHELLARADGHADLRRRLEVQGREDQEISLELSPTAFVPSAPAPEPEPLATSAEVESGGGDRLFTFIAGGTAVALAGTPLALWLVSDSKFEEEQDRCFPEGPNEPGICTEDDNPPDDSFEKLQTASYVVGGVAAAAAVAAVALFFIEGDTGESTEVAIGPGSVLVRGQF